MGPYKNIDILKSYRSAWWGSNRTW